MKTFFGINITVKCNVKEVLEKIKENRENHIKLVEKAKAGYIRTAKQMLEEKLSDINQNKVIPLNISLKLPKDHTAEYDTAIKTLEMHQEITIDLDSDTVRTLIEDKWDWTEEFSTTNSAYL